MRRPRRLSAILATILAAFAVAPLAACAPGGSAEPADMVGTWTGEYTYPRLDGTTQTSTETIVITKQEGLLLWGYEEWDAGTGPQRDPLAGQIGIQGTTFVLVEEEGFFSGVVDGDRMAVRYISTGESPTTFELELTRS